MNKDKTATENKYTLVSSALTSNKGKRLLGMTSTVLILCLFIFFVIKPTISTILETQQQIIDSQLIIGQLDTKTENLNKLRVQYSKIQDDLPILMNAVPAEPDVESLFGQIQTVAQKSNVSITKLENSEVAIAKNNGDQQNDNKFSFSVGGEGSPESISEFLEDLVGMERVIDINTFLITTSTTEGGTSNGFDIQSTAFFQK